MPRSRDFLIDYFVGIKPMPLAAARTMIGATAQLLVAAAAEAPTVAARRKLLLTHVEITARRPHPALIEEFTAMVGEPAPRARSIVRGVSLALLGQAARESGRASDKAVVVAALVRRAAKWPISYRAEGEATLTADAAGVFLGGPHGGGEGPEGYGRGPEGSGEGPGEYSPGPRGSGGGPDD